MARSAATSIGRGRAVVPVLAMIAVAGTILGACSSGGRVSTRGGTAPVGSAANAPAVAPSPVKVSEIRERALAILVEGATGDSPERRANSIEGLTATPTRLRSLLPAALADENLGVRTVAAMATGRLGLDRLEHALRPLVHDTSPMVRIAAVYALFRGGSTGPDADLSLISTMLWDDRPRVRAQAAFVLGELGEPSAVPMLKESIRGTMPRAPHNEIRLWQLQLAEARVKLGDEEPLQELRAALYPSRPDDFEGTALAAQILGLVGDRRSIDQLVYLTAWIDPTGRPMPPEVRLAAAASLAKLGLPQGGFLARDFAGDPRPTLRAQSAHVFGQTGLPTNLPALDQMMNDPDPLVRTAAAAAVLQITERPPPGSRGR